MWDGAERTLEELEQISDCIALSIKQERRSRCMA